MRNQIRYIHSYGIGMKRRFFKRLFKLLIILFVFEFFYLFLFPVLIQKFITKDFLFSIVAKNSNISLNAQKLVIKTNIKPSLLISLNKLEASEKINNTKLLSADNIDLEVSIPPLLFKTISLKHFFADNLELSINKNNNQSYNFENLFKSGNSNFKLEQKNVNIKTNGAVYINNSKADFEIDMKYSMPVSFKNLSQNNFNGSILLYNINLEEFLPFIKKLAPDIKQTGGVIDFLQISASKQDDKKNQIVLNSKFHNILYNQKDWKNNIFAKGENKINASINLFDNIIKLNHLNYEADNIHINGNGIIEVKNKPDLDFNISVKNSRAEDIASILPDNLVKETMVIEKIKNYGVFGDINGEVKIKGIVPQPDITGFVAGRNIHILDKDTRKLHKGTVDIKFNKRTLDMDILVEMQNNQNAQIKGTTFLFRDGINDVKIKTTKNINFSLAHKLTIPISKVFQFQLGPLPDMKITSGNGEIDVHIKGSLDFIDLDGFCSFDNAQFTYNGLYGNVTNAKGRLDFKNDIIKIKSERAFIENNPFFVDGIVKINDNLNFNIKSAKSKADDLLEIINKSLILKDVKKGLALFEDAQGKVDLFVNIVANIVPVPFGQPPLPPEEAFKDIKVNGDVLLDDLKCFLVGFKVPVEKINGKVNFTETLVEFNDIQALSGVSPINIDGKILTDLKTKIPDVDITIKSNAIKTGDTIKFLTQSYLYPKNYPDISSFYNIDAKHDLFFKYKAKSIDFITNKAYVVMNFLQSDNSNNVVKAKSGKIVVDKSNVEIDNITADILNSNINISGNVKKIDTINPIYNLTISSDKFNLEHLNKNLKIIPGNVNEILSQFSDYKGFIDFIIKYQNNILNLSANLKGFSFIHKKSSIPLKFDDFSIGLNDDKFFVKNITANLDNAPIFADLKISNLYKIPNIDGIFTTKITNEFIKNYLPEDISQKIKIYGDINISSTIKGNIENLKINPKVTLYNEADALISGTRIGDSADKRVFNSEINITKDIININRIDYYKYITNQNNAVYPALFAYGGAILKLNKANGIYELISGYIKTEKSLSTKLLNLFFNKSLFKQGTITCDLKYADDKIKGEIDARNIDMPIVDAIIKNVKINADDENINARLFGFVNDSVIRLESSIVNNLKNFSHINSIKIKADKIDTDKLLNSIAKARNEFNIQKERNTQPNLSIFEIENGELQIDKLSIKNYTAENITSIFSIDEKGIFKLKDINVKIGDGSITGEILYDLKNTDIEAQLDFKNVDSNYMAENLFDAKNQIYGLANTSFIVKTKGNDDEELIKNLSGFAYFDIKDGKMPKLGSLEYLLRAGNIIKGGVTGFTINNVLEILNLVKTGYFSSIDGSCNIENGVAKDIEIFSQGENLSLYMHGNYDIPTSYADLEILGKLSNRISTIFGPIGNASINTFFKYIPGISMLDFGRKDFIENLEKIPPFTTGEYDSRAFQAIINGDINSSKYVQSFKWIKQ